jgi:hypothetical protein
MNRMEIKGYESKGYKPPPKHPPYVDMQIEDILVDSSESVTQEILGNHTSARIQPVQSDEVSRLEDHALFQNSSMASTLAAEGQCLLSSPRLPNVFDNGTTQIKPQFDMEWEHIKILRLDILSLRSEIQQKRLELRDKQLAKSTADDLLLRYIVKKQLGQIPATDSQEAVARTIEDLIQKAQDARNVYGPVEDDCNVLEDQLSEKEFNLTRLEESFYSRGNVPSGAHFSPRISAAIQRISPPPSDILDDDSDIQYHPFVIEFLSKWGDLDILKERRSDFEERKETLEEQKESLLRAELPLDSEDQDWLDSSSITLQELDQAIASTDIEVGHLRRKCFVLGLVDEDGEPTDFKTQEKSTFSDDKEVDPKGEVSEYVKYPSLLPLPTSKQGHIYNRFQESDSSSEKALGMINRWLLDRLRTSALDVRLLVSIFEHDIGKTDERWEGAVLALWYTDETSKATKAQEYTRSMRTQAPRCSNETTASSDYDGGTVHRTPGAI